MTTADKFFFPNDAADTRCVQACYQMVVGRLTGEIVPMAIAEIDTGYAEDRVTWQFAMLLSFAEKHGLRVVDYEDFDPYEFVDDPIAAIRGQIDDEEAVQYQLAKTDLPAEVARLKACLASGKVQFKRGAPSYEDLRNEVENGAHVICVVNGAVLTGDEGYRPHSVVVKSISDEGLLIDDPGPPPHADWLVSTSQFMDAWANPTPSVTNYIACRVDRAI